MRSLLQSALSSRAQQRRGNILVLSAVFFVIVLGFAAFTIDIGYISVVKTQLQCAVDAATLAGAMELDSNGTQATVATNVKNAVMEVAALNRVGQSPGLVLDPDVDIQLGRQEWDTVQQQFVYQWGLDKTPYNIVRVDGRLDIVTNGTTTIDRRLPLFFAPVFGTQSAALTSTSIATFQPRDMMLVLDFSSSMNDDTEFGQIPVIGHSTVTNAITQMWGELGNPSYGNMPFTPSFLTVGGVPANGTIPHIDVTYKGTQVSITSTENISTVRLKFSNNNTQTFTNVNATTTTLQGTGGNANKRINNVWVLSGTNSNLSTEGWGEKFNVTQSNIITHLGLTTYPYSGGSWSDFINYVETSSNVNTAGFRYKYGTMCLINYWLEKYPSYSQCPDLWKCSAQPVTICKRASDTLIDYIVEVEAEDKLGLVIYSHSNTAGALLEHALTDDLNAVKPYYTQRQAGHYTGGTNIKAGMAVARQELEANARPQAFRMMVLMTDGLPNQGGADPYQAAIDQAYLCKNSKIRVMTVSVGADADTTLMQEIADITGGIHFEVPGGATFAEYQQALEDAFRSIAANRPLRLLPGAPAQQN